MQKCLKLSEITARELLIAVIVLMTNLLSVPVFSQPSENGFTGPFAPLDGMTFSANIVREGADEKIDEPLADQLTFSGGNFSSAICRRYNFNEAPYWVRTKADRIHFLTELTSPTDGTMVWEGSVRDGVLEGTMRWTKRRWYWTVVAEHRIRGKVDRGLSPIPRPHNLR